MKKRMRLIGCLCLSMLLLAFAATTALASERSSVKPMSPEAPFDFTMTTGGPSQASGWAQKTDYTNADIYPSAGSINSLNPVYFRVHDYSYNPVSNLLERYNLNSFTLTYNSGDATPGTYCLYGSAPSGDQYSTEWVDGNWYP